jgi:hypothetical protein
MKAVDFIIPELKQVSPSFACVDLFHFRRDLYFQSVTTMWLSISGIVADPLKESN